MINLLVCDCGKHEFVIVTGLWLPLGDGLAARIRGCCTHCGKDWNLNPAIWASDELLQQEQKEAANA